MTVNEIHDYCIQNNVLIDEYEFISWLSIVKPVLEHPEFLKRRLFKHHENQNVIEHCILVSANAYELALKLNVDVNNCTIAGILHDFYTKAWQYSPELEELDDDKYKENFIPGHLKKPFLKKHGFTHPLEALENAKEYFPELMNSKIENAIATHMFPLSLTTDAKLPLCKEAWIVQLADKIVGINDLPTLEESFKYLGLRKPKKSE